MAKYYILDASGEAEEVTFEEWCPWFDNAHLNRVVKQETLPTGEKVSTVFLGVDHSWGHGPPQLFETMVFGGSLNEEYQRCSTRAEALKQHDRMKLAVLCQQPINKSKD